MSMYNLWLERSYLLEVKDAIDDGEPFTAYVSNLPGDPTHVSSWMGTTLGVVGWRKWVPSRGPTTGYWALRVWVGGDAAKGHVSSAARLYWGRSQGPGMVINLRPCKRYWRP